MSDTKVDISHIHFTSSAAPTEEDMKLWHSLTPEEQEAVVIRDIEEGLASGVIDGKTASQIVEDIIAGKMDDR